MPRKSDFALEWPHLGLFVQGPYENQPHQTTIDAQNVRTFEAATGRGRGGQRPGLSKYVDTVITTAKQVQDIGQSADRAAPTAQTALGTRTIYRYAVADGAVKKFDDTTVTSITGATLSTTTPIICSAELFGTVYFADGGGTLYSWDTSGTTLADWGAAVTDGTIPSNPRLICTYRSRILLSGNAADPHNWYMSAVGDPLNWDYAPTTETVTQAVAGNNADAGESADVINGMIPFNDDLVVFLGDHTVSVMRGDPAAGGVIDKVTDTVGGAWGKAWAMDPTGTIYFFGSRGGVYKMQTSGDSVSIPVDITAEAILEEFTSVNLSTTVVRMAWDDRAKGLYVWLTDLGGGASSHYFYDSRRNAWWKDVYANADHNPTSAFVFDGDAPADRAVLLGCSDGFIRKIDHSAKGDDGTAIDAYVWIGPIVMKGRPRIMLSELRATLSSVSDGATLDVYPGEDVETAAAASSQFSRTLVAGRNNAFRNRAFGNAIFVRIRNATLGEAFEFEALLVELLTYGHRTRAHRTA